MHTNNPAANGTLLQQAFHPDAFREQGHALVDLLANYLQSCQARENMPVLPWQTPAQALEYWQNGMLSQDSDFAELASEVMRQSIHTHHPRYVGHQVVPPAPAAALAGLLGEFMNNGMAVYEMGPVATAMERALMQWLGGKFGWGSQADGVMVSGGSLGNLTALLAARQAKSPFDAWKEGAKNGPQLAIMVSEEAHYCVARSAQIMGLGEAGIIKVPADANFRMKAEMLETCYQQAISEGKIVIAVVGSACTTSTGSFDPLAAIADFCEKNSLWFHVDAAHGGASIMAEQHKYLLKGIERAHSAIVDFHKMMLAPALATAVLFREEADSYKPFSQQAAYLLDKGCQWYDIAVRTVECTKHPMSYKPYFLLKLYGEQLLADYVLHTYELAQTFANMIEVSGDFELLMRPSCNIVCFRYVERGLHEEALNELNAQLRQRMIESGRFYLVQTVVKGRRYLRTALMNALTQPQDLAYLLESVRELAVQIKQENVSIS